jgi:ADP-heptose:LPS heptosyltransferase
MKSLIHIALDLCVALKRARSVNSLKSLKEFRPEAVRRILVISCTAMGDTLFATPSIRALYKLLPHAHIDLLARNRFAPLFRNLPHVSDVLEYRGRCRGVPNLLSLFRKRRYDLCISLHDSDPCPVKTAWLAGIPFIFRIGQRDQACADFLSARTPYHPEAHAIQQRFDVLRLIFGKHADKACTPEMMLPVNHEEAKAFWKQKLQENGLNPSHSPIAGFQFSASGTYKTWPMENWAALGSMLLDRFPNSVVALFGGPSERQSAEKLGQMIMNKTASQPRIINLAGSMSLSRLPAALKGLDIFITNDTGPLHAAVAVKTPTVSLFVPTRINCIAPIQDREIHTVIKKEMPCTPCVEKYCRQPDCMRLITVDEVFSAVIKSPAFSEA